jgi:hypothetical protein
MISDQNDLLRESLQKVTEEMDFEWLNRDILGHIMFAVSFFSFWILLFYCIFNDLRYYRSHVFTVFLPFCFIFFYSFVTIFFLAKYIIFKMYIYYEISLDGIEYQNFTRNITLLLMIPSYFILLYVFCVILLPFILNH